MPPSEIELFCRLLKIPAFLSFSLTVSPILTNNFKGEDYMAIYETIDRKRAEAKEMKNKSASMEELETPTNSIKSFQMSATRSVTLMTLMVVT